MVGFWGRLCALLCVLLLGQPAGVNAQDAKGGKHASVTLDGHAKGRGISATCENGTAAGYPCANVHLLSFMSLADLGAGPGIGLNDAWGWVDPHTGQRWALMGREDGVAFVDITDPYSPRYAGQLPMPSTAQVNVWRDIKVDGWYAFVVADGGFGRQGAHGMQVFDLRRLREAIGAPITFDADAQYTEFNVAHNVVINEETDRAYVVGARLDQRSCNGGLHIVDISEPLLPVFAGCFADVGTGRQGGGYVHDAQCVLYRGPDRTYQGREICIGSNETAISIADVTDADNPVGISRGTYPSASYVHQGWLTEDQRYFIQNDELDERVFDERTHTYIWDLTDLEDPVLLVDFTSDAVSTDHNLYVRGTLAYQANYASGLRIMDISDPANPFMAGYFDTRPDDHAVNFNGAWTAWPFPSDDLVIISSRGEGLFVDRPAAMIGTRFTQFEAQALEDGSIDLRWSVNTSRNVERFDIVHIGPGLVQSIIASVAPSADDGEVSAMLTMGEGIFRFRIAAVGIDGARMASEDAIVNTLVGTHLLKPVWPNPARETVYSHVAVSRTQNVRITIHDALGRDELRFFLGSLAADQALDIRMNVQQLAPGTYYLHIVGEDFSDTRPFVVTR